MVHMGSILMANGLQFPFLVILRKTGEVGVGMIVKEVSMAEKRR